MHFVKIAMKKILVVDDNEILLRAWERILKKEPCQFIVTNNPEEAVQIMEEKGADILISDIVMPKMDGFDLMKRVLRNHQGLQVVLTTGYICDFSNINLDVELKDLHIVMKPYNDINGLQGFVHKLVEGDESVNDEKEAILGKNNVHLHLWNL